MLKLYNTLTREKEILKKKLIKIYVCGPTVYDYAHLGHGRSAVVFDLLRRYLLFKGYNIRFVSNYTDIDDKIIKRAKERNLTEKQLTEEMITAYEEDYSKLNILKPDVQPKATEYIKEMISLIKKLEKNNYTYIISGDGVYYDISKFKDYGKLSHQKIEDLEAGKRINNENKRNPEDFVLWKFYKEGEPFWGSKWGKGRPGWHIECSAMSTKILGKRIDIHGGGQDLIFPHHEDEIAQTEAIIKKQFSRFWMHNGFVTVNDEKMSKSLENFFLLRDIYKKYDPLVIRWFLLTTSHYRAPLNYSEDMLEQSKHSLEKLKDFTRRLKEYDSDSLGYKNTIKMIKIYEKEFIKKLDDDLEISGALNILYEFLKEANILLAEKRFSEEDSVLLLEFIEKIDSVLGVLKEEEIPKEIIELTKKRLELRKEKNWFEADKIREEIRSKGYNIDDSDGKSIIKRL